MPIIATHVLELRIKPHCFYAIKALMSTLIKKTNPEWHGLWLCPIMVSDKCSHVIYLQIQNSQWDEQTHSENPWLEGLCIWNNTSIFDVRNRLQKTHDKVTTLANRFTAAAK